MIIKSYIRGYVLVREIPILPAKVTGARNHLFLAFASWCARIDLTQPFASVLAALVQGVRGPDASGPILHCAAPLPVPPAQAPPAATNSSHGACNGPTPPSR